MSSFTDVLKTVAPGLATALIGPLGGLAVAAIGKALDMPEATQETIQARLQGVTQDDLLKLKLADQQFAKDMRALDIDLERIAAGDRDSARRMAVESQSLTPSVLSWLIVCCTLGLEGYVLLNGIPAGVSELVAGRVLGTLDMAFATVLAFWLGTSASSRSKDITIGNLVK